MRLLREWQIVIVVGVVSLAVGIFLGRLTVSVSPPSEVSVNFEAYTTCMYIYRDVVSCAEVMKKLTRAEAN